MITIIYLGQLADLLDIRQEQLKYDEELTCQELINNLMKNNKQLNDIINTLPIIKFAVNHKLVNNDFIIKDGDEVAILPPVTGG